MKKFEKLTTLSIVSIALLTGCSSSPEFVGAEDALAQLTEFMECGPGHMDGAPDANPDEQVPAYSWAGCNMYFNPARPSGEYVYVYVVNSGESIDQVVDYEASEEDIQLVGDTWVVLSYLDEDAPTYQTDLFENIKKEWGGDLIVPGK